MALKLIRLPQGTNRSHILRRSVDLHDEEINLAELERLFRRFWRVWHKSPQKETREVGT
jgi:hypothetical protein